MENYAESIKTDNNSGRIVSTRNMDDYSKASQILFLKNTENNTRNEEM